MPNMMFLSLIVQKMTKVEVLKYVSQSSRSRSVSQNFLHDLKDLITQNVHVKYQSSISNDPIVMAKVNVF